MYKFVPGEPTSAAFRAIAISQLDEVLADLETPGADLGETIHEARRRCKKLRGLLRLVRSSFPDYASENAALRDAAALLSHLRDADVLKQTIAGLADHAGADRERLLAVGSRLQMGSSGDDVAAKLREFRLAIVAIRERAGSWSVGGKGSRTAIAGLKATYRNGRKGMLLAARTRLPADLHEWRKATKYHGFHVDLLKRTAPDVLAAEVDLVERLATCLGEHHDLAVLTEAASANPARFGDEGDVPALLATTAARRQQIEDEAFELGRQIFVERPAALAHRFRAYWRGTA